MQKVKVYDLPTRMFHILFGTLFVLSFSIGKFVDDDSSLYAYHMISGITMTFMVLLRIIWGFIGTKYAKFNSFKLNPKDLISYFSNIFTGKTKRELGHNPASSYAAIAMFIFTFIQIGTGLLMINGITKDFFEEIHEISAFAFAITVILHISGVIFHQMRHKDGMAFSMINGQKESISGQEEISNQAPMVLVIFLILLFVFVGNLLNNYDANKGSLNVFGVSLQLGEKENEHSTKYYNEYYDLDEDDGEDED